MSDLANQFLRDHFGLGPSTFGHTMDEHNKGRSEAEAREALGRHRKDWEMPREADARCEREVQKETRRAAVQAMWDKLQDAYPDYRINLITDDMALKVLDERERRLWNDAFADAEERRARREDARGTGWDRI